MNHDTAMKIAMTEAELARGATGDNPWVGSVILIADVVVARGHTLGPGEDHAEIGALRAAIARGIDLGGATLYSTIEPCSFHGRTPACAGVIVHSGVRCVVTGIRDPNPKVDGAGLSIIRAAGIDVIEEVCASEIRRQLGSWIARFHPHEPIRRARAMRALGHERLTLELMQVYAIDVANADAIARRALE